MLSCFSLDPDMSVAPPPARHWYWPPLLLLGCAVVCLAWATLVSVSGRQMGWMILVGALEACWMLSLGGLRAGRLRIGVAMAATLGMFVIGNALIGALLTGESMGIGLLESSWRIGLDLSLAYATVRNGPAELVMLVLALLLTWRLAR